MAFELKKPCSNEERCSFIITHNHKNGLRIVDTPEYLYALEKNEILENNIPTIDPTYEERKKEAVKSIILMNG